MILEVNSLELHTAWIIHVELKTIILPVGIIHGDCEILTLFNAEWYETVPPFDSVDEILVRRIQTFSR